MGELLLSGIAPRYRRTGLAGPGIECPRLLRLPPGADVSALPEATRADLVCGSVLAGRPARAPFEHLGRFHRQVTALSRWHDSLDARRGLPLPGRPVLLHPGKVRPPAGGMLPHDGLDRTWALSAPAAPLLRALMTGDHERAATLGCLDLGEDDLALASLACPGGHDYGAYLRETLDTLLREHTP